MQREAVSRSRLEELARSAQSGDPGAFNELVETTSSQIYALCLRLSGNEHDARDIMQDTYLRVFRSLSGFRGQSSFSTWIYRIAANCASSHLSKRRRRLSRVLHVDAEEYGNLPASASDLDPEAASQASSDRRELVEALRRLPFSLRSVVVLRDVYDLTYEEIAAELRISRAAVKVRLHRGRRRLQESLFGNDRFGASTSAADPVPVDLVPVDLVPVDPVPVEAGPVEAGPDEGHSGVVGVGASPGGGACA